MLPRWRIGPHSASKDENPNSANTMPAIQDQMTRCNTRTLHTSGARLKTAEEGKCPAANSDTRKILQAVGILAAWLVQAGSVADEWRAGL